MAFKIQKIKSYSGILYIYGFNCCKNIKKYVDWLNLKFIMHESLFFYLKNAIIKIRGSAEKLTLEKGSATRKRFNRTTTRCLSVKKIISV